MACAVETGLDGASVSVSESEQAHSARLHSGQFFTVSLRSSWNEAYSSHGRGFFWLTESRSHCGVTTAFRLCLKRREYWSP